jgi:hypothetical protein
MKTNKEYPATHSMSTSWYAVDKEGNVAFLSFDDNGPVPSACRGDKGIYDLLFGIFPRLENGDKYIDLSEEQLMLLMQGMSSPAVSKDFVECTIVQIDAKQRTSFFNLIAKMHDTDYYILSEEKGLYLFDCIWPYSGRAEEMEAFHQLFSCGIITSMREYGDLEVCFLDDDECNPSLEAFPFYIFRQDYSGIHPLRRLVSPVFPFREDQLSPEQRANALRIDGRFENIRYLRIENVAPCDYSYPGTRMIPQINGRQYHLVSDHDGKEWFFALESPASENHCGRDCKVCFKRETNAHHFKSLMKTFYPTIMVIYQANDPENMENLPAMLANHVIFKNILDGIPTNDSRGFLSDDELKSISPKRLNKLFLHCHLYLTENILFFMPYAIMITKAAYSQMIHHYVFRDGVIVIGDTQIPFYFWEDLNAVKDEIEELAKLPYRGQTVELSIPALFDPEDDLSDKPYRHRGEFPKGYAVSWYNIFNEKE